MANVKNSLKSSVAKADGGTRFSNVVSLPQVRANGKASGLVSQIDKFGRGLKATIQGMKEKETEAQRLLILCIEHFEKHGDANPADRLVKTILLENHPSSTAMAREVMAHFRNNSPIRWESKSPYKLFVLKANEEGYKAPDVAKAQEVAFNDTPQAQRARAIGQAAQSQALKEADLTMLVKRAAGVVTFWNRMVNGTDDRKIKPGEDAKMVKFLKEMNKIVEAYAPSAVVPIAKSKAA